MLQDAGAKLSKQAEKRGSQQVLYGFGVNSHCPHILISFSSPALRNRKERVRSRDSA